MIRIGNFKNLIPLADTHYERVFEHLSRKGNILVAYMVDAYFKKTKCQSCKGKTFRDLITGDLDFLEHLKSDHKKWFSKPEVSNVLLNLYSNTFSRRGKYVGDKSDGYNAFKLTNDLKINVCPYCNRNYIYNIKAANQDEVRFNQIDHYHPKDTSPFLAMSFYNLIPSCGQCNFLKNNQSVTFHPYKNLSTDPVKFRVTYTLKNDDISLTDCGPDDLELTHKPIMDDNMEVLYLKELYKGHIDHVNELLLKIELFNQGYFEEIKDLLDDKTFTKDDFCRILFGNYYESHQFSSRPLAKLSRDILDQFGIKL